MKILKWKSFYTTLGIKKIIKWKIIFPVFTYNDWIFVLSSIFHD